LNFGPLVRESREFNPLWQHHLKSSKSLIEERPLWRPAHENECALTTCGTNLCGIRIGCSRFDLTPSMLYAAAAMSRRSTKQPPPKSRPYRDPPRPPLTLGELRKGSCWLWAYCRGRECHRSVPLALAPFIIRWGASASSDRLRRSFRCSACGGKGAMLMMPSHVGGVGLAPFPI
jgi:hypothetical protein